MANSDIFDRLMVQIHQRVKDMPEGSYTTKLLKAGHTKMGAKILEEVLETTLAASEPDAAGKAHLIREAGDVIYHLWVLLGSRGVTVDDIRQELERREGTSGLEEKNNRTIGIKA
jgi:phosphoribosyl-ATP pyrophosphohydrolase